MTVLELIEMLQQHAPSADVVLYTPALLRFEPGDYVPGDEMHSIAFASQYSPGLLTLAVATPTSDPELETTRLAVWGDG